LFDLGSYRLNGGGNGGGGGGNGGDGGSVFGLSVPSLQIGFGMKSM
jgi:hypothetical protein